MIHETSFKEKKNYKEHKNYKHETCKTSLIYTFANRFEAVYVCFTIITREVTRGRSITGKTLTIVSEVSDIICCGFRPGGYGLRPEPFGIQKKRKTRSDKVTCYSM